MRAAVLRAGQIEVRETADPVPGRGQVLVRTLSCAICAFDLHFMDNPAAGSPYDVWRTTALGGRPGRAAFGDADADHPGCVAFECVGLDGVPDALDLARRGDGPARIMIHPGTGDSSRPRSSRQPPRRRRATP